MNNKSSCCRVEPRRARARVIEMGCFRAVLIACAFLLAVEIPVRAADAPQWMHSVVSAPLPAHDEKTDAVLLYSETDVTVIATDKIRTTVREAYKILRPNGR